MTKYEPIVIKPLTIRGVFGVTWNIYKRGFWSTFVFTLAFLAAGFVVTILPMLPAIGGLGSLVSIADGYASSYDIGAGIAGMFASSLLSLVSVAALYLLLMPIFNGTMFGEMSARVYGDASGVGGLFSRTKYSLKRFFTTSLAEWVAEMALGLALSIIMGIICFVFIFSVVSSAMSGAIGDDLGTIAALILLFTLIIGTIATAGTAFLSFTYPVAVNENARAFKAVGRSLKLASKKFGRVFGCQMILFGIMFVIIALFTLICINIYWQWELMCVIISVMSILTALIFAPYAAALATTLYFDIRTREEGEGWLSYSSVQADAFAGQSIELPPVAPETSEVCETSETCGTCETSEANEVCEDSKPADEFGSDNNNNNNNDPYKID